LQSASLGEIRKQYPELQKSADTARDALVRGQRPWVGVVGVPVVKKAVYRLGKNLGVDVSILAKNYGPAPALHVHMEAGWFHPQTYRGMADYIQQWDSAVDDLCGAASSDLEQIYKLPPFGNLPSIVPPLSGATIFPNDTVGQDTGAQTGSFELLKENFSIVGCIAYGDQFGKEIHHTRFCYSSYAPASQLTTSTPLRLCATNQSAE
jgi:hypothetical protein